MIIKSKAPAIVGSPVNEYYIRRDPEMLFYLYLPIKLADQGTRSILKNVPKRLRPFKALINQCLDYERLHGEPFDDKYVYLTVKTLFVTPEYIGGRPGWHTDGFGTQDINYIWASDTPTEFCVQQFDVSANEHQSIADMTEQAKDSNIQTYDNKVLRLTPYNVHRCPIVASPRVRTFFRLSFSSDRYNMAGNSHNYLLDYRWKMQGREAARNKTAVG